MAKQIEGKCHYISSCRELSMVNFLHWLFVSNKKNIENTQELGTGWANPFDSPYPPIIYEIAIHHNK